jgi:hypothetical protein
MTWSVLYRRHHAGLEQERTSFQVQTWHSIFQVFVQLIVRFVKDLRKRSS